MFNSEYGGHLPEDICLYIENMPTKWQVVPWEGDKLESLPEVPDDLIVEVRIFFPYMCFKSNPEHRHETRLDLLIILGRRVYELFGRGGGAKQMIEVCDNTQSNYGLSCTVFSNGFTSPHNMRQWHWLLEDRVSPEPITGTQSITSTSQIRRQL